ncbi:hypothetical protein ABC733_17075 [Mangrovibacter sp. SLW1]
MLYEYQVAQYELSVDSIRRLEDKATKLLGGLSLVLTVTLLILRYWWNDLFVTTAQHSPLQVICWLFLFSFLMFSVFSWGYTFSVMIPKEFSKPSASQEITPLFVERPQYLTMTECANTYSQCTDVVDELHAEKVRMINHCTQSMLLGSWSFLFFLIFFSS